MYLPFFFLVLFTFLIRTDDDNDVFFLEKDEFLIFDDDNEHSELKYDSFSSLEYSFSSSSLSDRTFC